jgi:sulfur relay (sulfurtransferase) DsrF/TusC family protein
LRLCQDSSGLVLGDWKQTQPPRIDDDLARMIGKDVAVYALAEDLAERGLADAPMVSGVRRLPRSELPRLMQAYDRVWRW